MRSLIAALIILFTMAFSAGAQVGIDWRRVYGDKPYNYGMGVIQEADRDYVFLMNTSSFVGSTSIHLLNTDSMGVIKWDKQIGDTSLFWASDFELTSDRGFVITGYTYPTTQQGYDVLLIKTDSLGQIQWISTAGGTDWDMASSVKATSDSAYIVVGKTFSYDIGNGDIYVLKFNSFGDTIWTRVLGGDSADFAASVDILSDSIYLVGANTRSYGKGGMDVWAVKYSSAGDTLWSRFYGDTADDRVYTIKCTADKGFVWSGCTRSYGGVGLQGWLERVDSNGTFMWKLPEFWEIAQGNNTTYNVSLNDSGQYVVSGASSGVGPVGFDYVIAVLKDWHQVLFANSFGELKDEEALESIQTHDKGYIMVGTSYGGIGPANTNMYVVKTNSSLQAYDTTIYTTGFREITFVNENVVRIYPNPSAGVFNINLDHNTASRTALIRVFNSSGSVVLELQYDLSFNRAPVSINLGGQPSGLYLVDIITGDKRWSKKIIRK